MLMTFNFRYNYKLISRMIENHFENINILGKKIVQSPLKNENVLYSSVSPNLDYSNKFGKSNSMHPNQQPVHLIHTSWVPSNGQPLPTRIIPPNNTLVSNAYPLTNRKPSFIELGGGSRQKKNSPDRMTITLGGQDKCQQVVTPQYLNRKIMILQGRIKELHRQKQMMAAEMNQKVNKILSENERLINIIKDFQQKSMNSTGEPKIQGKEKELQNEFNLEEMLESQINVNLELREELQKHKIECESACSKLANSLKEKEVVHSKIEEKQAQNSSLKLSHQKLQIKLRQQNEKYCQKIRSLETTIASLEQTRQKRETAIEQVIQEKEKRILQLEQQNYGLSKRIEENALEIAELGEEVSASKMQHMCESQEIQTLKNQVQELSKPQQCKKCKDLLYTVFRLNSQLNRK